MGFWRYERFFLDSLAVTHKYTDTGNYTVRLVAVSKKGCRDTFYENVRIWPDRNTSFEVYEEGKLVGGLYGVSIGKAFFGESMFHLVKYNEP